MMASSFRIMDTSIYLTILGVPKHERGTLDRIKQLRGEIEHCAKSDITIIIPFGTIIETGNHIANSPNDRRWDIVNRFIGDVTAALNYQAPYSLGKVSQDTLREWLDLFREHSSSHVEFGDITCIDEFNRCREMFPSRPVSIWSDDMGLLSYRYNGDD